MGYLSVRKLIKSRTRTVAGCQTLVSDELNNLNYVYKHPERKVSASHPCCQTLNLTLVKTSWGAFRSALISKVYSVHLRKLKLPLVVKYRYGYQIGALALAAAAVCQSLHPQ